MKWNTTDLYKSIDDPKISKDLKGFVVQARSFEKKHKVGLAKYSEKQLLDFFKEYEKISVKIYLLGGYIELVLSTKSTDPKTISFYQRVEVALTEIQNFFIFITLELAKHKDLVKLAGSKVLGNYAVILEDIAKIKKYQLSFSEEKLVNIKSLTASSGWVKLLEKTIAGYKLVLKGKEVTLEQAVSTMYSPNRAERKAAAAEISKVLKVNADLVTHIFNMIVIDKSQEDKIRGFEYPEQGRNIGNDVTKKTVDTLTAVTVKNFPLVSRFYTIKKKLLHLDELKEYDRYAPVPFKGSSEKITFDGAVAIVRKAFQNFDSEFAAIFSDLIKSKKVDSEPYPGKRGGAYCMYMPAPHKPFVFMNFTGYSRDVQTLAHEMGHAIHDVLAERKNSFLTAHAPLTLAETASVFGEMIVMEDLLAHSKSKQESINLLVSKIDDTTATVYRQISMFIFEKKVHQEVLKNGQISKDQINKFWAETLQQMFGKSVSLSGDHDVWWSYVTHFFHTPFYVYSYAFGNILVFSLYKKFREGEPNFVAKYKELLASGGTKSPQDAVKPFGFNLEDPKFWQAGFDFLEQLIDKLEALC